MSFSFRKYERGAQSAWVAKILRRTLLIFLVGILLNWYPFFNKSLSELRIFGVLQRIALAYGGAALLVVWLGPKRVIWAFWSILIGYWVILLGFGGDAPLSLEDNAVRKLDLFLFGPDHVYHGYGLPFDPEGLLSTLPSIATVIFGYYMGLNIQQEVVLPQKIKTLLTYGVAGVALGVLWNFLGFPINKPIWSSSYVLFTGGLASGLLALLIWLIDVKGFTKWAYVFRAFGLNPLISYVLSGLILKTFFLWKVEGVNIYGVAYSQFFQPLLGNYLGSFIQALVYTLLIWVFAWILYQKRIIIKL